jgi:hypothetical protein
MTIVSATSSKRRWSLRAGVIAALAVSAVPASAAVIVQNFMTVDITRAAPCLAKINGLDNAGALNVAGNPVFNNLANTTNSTQGVPLLNEKVTLTAYRGDRLISTDGIRVSNTCSYAVTVFLKAEPGLAATTTSGNWNDLHAKVYLGKQSMAAPAAPALSGIDFATVADWDAAPLSITPSATGTVANATTGTVTIAAGSSVQLGYLVDAGAAPAVPGPASPAAGVTATLNYTVNATKA